LDCQINDISQETVQHWENMKNIGSKAPKIKAENLIYFGVRDTEGRR
jgi:arginase